jgi:hypothetical protein
MGKGFKLYLLEEWAALQVQQQKLLKEVEALGR